MSNKGKILLGIGVLFFVYLFANEARWFKPTDYLTCKTAKGTFYLKIIQRSYKAEEYFRDNYLKEELIKSFDLDIKQNYLSLVDDLSLGYPEYSKTDDFININRKTLKIYDPIKQVNLGECISRKNKI